MHCILIVQLHVIFSSSFSFFFLLEMDVDELVQVRALGQQLMIGTCFSHSATFDDYDLIGERQPCQTMGDQHSCLRITKFISLNWLLNAFPEVNTTIVWSKIKFS